MKRDFGYMAAAAFVLATAIAILCHCSDDVTGSDVVVDTVCVGCIEIGIGRSPMGDVCYFGGADVIISGDTVGAVADGESDTYMAVDGALVRVVMYPTQTPTSCIGKDTLVLDTVARPDLMWCVDGNGDCRW